MTTGEWIKFVVLFLVGMLPMVVGLNLDKVEAMWQRFRRWLKD